MDTDTLASVSKQNTAKVVMRLLDRMQDFPKHEQVAAVACLFLLLIKQLKLSPSYLLSIASHITATKKLFKSEEDKVFYAVEAYIEGEIING